MSLTEEIREFSKNALEKANGKMPFEPTYTAKVIDLDKEYTEETLSIVTSSAINQLLKKENEQMLPIETAKPADLSPLEQAIERATPQPTLNDQGLEIIGETSLTQVAESLADNTKPLTKKQKRAQKHAKKNLMGQLRNMQRQGQAKHINALLAKRVHYTEEQQIQLHAGHNAQQDLRNIMGPRQSEAFFAAKADTLCTDFFPAPTIAANPVLMIAANGSSRTLAQVYEYFIYKHHCLLVKAKDDAKELGMSEQWDQINPTPFVALEEAPSLDEVAQGDVV